MVESSFCFLSGVAHRTERRWWRSGIGTWDDFLAAPTVPKLGPARKSRYDEALSQARERRARDDARYFARHFRPRDQWRLYEWLRPRAVYLDIETDSFGEITVVGLYGNGRTTSLIRGESLSLRRLRDELGQYDLLVTFCGTTFDLPVLLAHVPSLPLEQPHVDLCFLGRQLGYRGGLKAIEVQVGIERDPDLQGLSGADAVRLWNRWRHGRDAEALSRVVAYNEADCVNLQPLADLLYCRMARLCREDLP